MSHSEVMKWFEYYFPDYAGERICLLYTSDAADDLTSFLNGMKGGKK